MASFKINVHLFIEIYLLIFFSVFQAPGDAEALCAWLVREGIVDAVASEDMDTLPFGANVLVRQFNAKKDKYELCNLCSA